MNTTKSLLKTLLQNPFSITTKHQAKQLHAQILKFQILYNPIIIIYTNNSLFNQCLSSFCHMRILGQYPDHNTFPSVLKSCTHLRDLRLGESVHGCVIRVGLDLDLYTCNALMNMYLKLQSLSSNGVRYVFDRRPELKKKENLGLICNGVIIGSVRKVFEMMPKRDLVSWNTVINGMAQNGMYREALETVRELGTSGLWADSFTLSSMLPICAEYVDVLKGKEIHGYAIRRGFGDDVYIGSGLIDMYANCTRIEDSNRVFKLLPRKDSVSWNSLIAGCVQTGMFVEGISLFRQMLSDNFAPRPVSFSSIIPACAHLQMITLGKEIHGYTIRRNLDDNMFIVSSLVDMYARFGNIIIARYIFNTMKQRDIVTYTAIIMGCALHGHPHESISLFEKMEMEGVKPNKVTFLAVLSACAHAKLIDEGWFYFKLMVDTYAITPNLEHYASMADLLGRAGRLEEAYEFISSMHIPPTADVWLTLLSACTVHQNVELAEQVAEIIISLDPQNIGSYVLLSNLYSASKMWNGAAIVRTRMKANGMKKNPACSWIEIKQKVHAFISGDKSNPFYDKINEVLGALLEVMEKEGCVGDKNELLLDVED